MTNQGKLLKNSTQGMFGFEELTLVGQKKPMSQNYQIYQNLFITKMFAKISSV